MFLPQVTKSKNLQSESFISILKLKALITGIVKSLQFCSKQLSPLCSGQPGLQCYQISVFHNVFIVEHNIFGPNITLALYQSQNLTVRVSDIFLVGLIIIFLISQNFIFIIFFLRFYSLYFLSSGSVSSSETFCHVSGIRKHSSLMPSWEAWSALYPSVPNLLRGALSAEEHKGVECPKCGRHYKLKSSLRNHQKWECGKEPQFQCPYCNYRAKQKMHVARHIERMHREKLDILESMHDRSIKEESSALFQQDIA